MFGRPASETNHVVGAGPRGTSFLERLLAVIEESLKAAREKHYEAHVHWEWWTAANGAGWQLDSDYGMEFLAKVKEVSDKYDPGSIASRVQSTTPVEVGSPDATPCVKG